MNTQEITAERLAGWAKKLAESNATPFALIGIGHGPHNGATILCISDNVTEASVADILRGVANQLATRRN